MVADPAEDECAVETVGDEPVRIKLLEADIERLRDEVAGLRRAQSHRAVIEQAKGSVMAMTGCTADEAFSLIRSMSQRSNRKLVDVADDLVARLRQGAVAFGPALTAPDASKASHNGGWRVRTDLPWKLRSVHDDEQLRALVDLGAHLAAAGGWDDLVGVVVRRGLAALGARAGVLAVLGGDDCLDTWTYGYPHEVTEFYSRLPLGADLPIAECLREHRPVYFRSATEAGDRFPDLELQLGTEALAAIPLVEDGVTLGALGLSYDVPQEFDAGMRAFLEFAAQQCAFALARVRNETGPPTTADD
jgi:hypothetical protein